MLDRVSSYNVTIFNGSLSISQNIASEVSLARAMLLGGVASSSADPASSAAWSLADAGAG